jgi:hypothetical protein
VVGQATLTAEALSPQDTPAFDLWLFAADGSVKARIAEQVGMWATPAWADAGVLYGQAINPLRSVDSRYALYLRDRDGSNPRLLFPSAEEPGVEAPPQIAWAPDGKKFIFVYNGNLYLADVEGTPPRQLTSNNQNSRPRWAAARVQTDAAPGLESTPAITSTAPVTASDVLSPTESLQ